MTFTLLQASKEHKLIIQNLIQFYIYDFSEYTKCDVENDGLFSPYSYLDDFWEEKNNKFPYIIKKDGKYIGFVLVKFLESKERNYFSIAEFFILRKYRLEGIGKAIAVQVFDLHKGNWEVYQKDSNKPAQIFWKKVINEYTKGQFNEHCADGKRVQNFNS